jgi:hypothetical protein
MMPIFISLFTAVIPINYSSEFQEGFEATTQINFKVSTCSVWISLALATDINPCNILHGALLRISEEIIFKTWRS